MLWSLVRRGLLLLQLHELLLEPLPLRLPLLRLQHSPQSQHRLAAARAAAHAAALASAAPDSAVIAAATVAIDVAQRIAVYVRLRAKPLPLLSLAASRRRAPLAVPTRRCAASAARCGETGA